MFIYVLKYFQKYVKKIEEVQKQLEESENTKAILENEVQKLRENNEMIQEEMQQLDAQSKAMLDGFIDENEKLKEGMREMGASFEEANMVKGLMEEQVYMMTLYSVIFFGFACANSLSLKRLKILQDFGKILEEY